MITGPLKMQIDKLWEQFWTGGITNPLTVIEQISYLLFVRLLDRQEQLAERKARRTKRPYRDGFFAPDEQHLRWSQLQHLSAEKMLVTVRDEVFPHLRKMAERDVSAGQFMRDAQLMIQRPSLLVSAVMAIDELPLDGGDTKGDLYEYLLSKLTTAGINGQFRTPRHIIDMMVRLVDPKPTDRIVDPACGTAGFLVGAMQYLNEKYTSAEAVLEEKDEDGAVRKIYTGDLLEPYREHIQNEMFWGFDFDATMLRIAAMNLLLHGVEKPNIHYQDTLSAAFHDRHPVQASEHFQIVLANPPFKGSLDHDDVDKKLRSVVSTKKTELLFVALFLRMLERGGRCAAIVPDGVLFGSSKAHQSMRKRLLTEHRLDAVISMPSGVFKPYAGVSTAVLVFTKGEPTKKVWFYDMQADGFSLDDKRQPVDDNDIPDLLTRWVERDPAAEQSSRKKAFFVPVSEIKAAKWDLSINRYKDIEYEAVEYDPPREIIAQLRALNAEIEKGLVELEGML